MQRTAPALLSGEKPGPRRAVKQKAPDRVVRASGCRLEWLVWHGKAVRAADRTAAGTAVRRLKTAHTQQKINIPYDGLCEIERCFYFSFLEREVVWGGLSAFSLDLLFVKNDTRPEGARLAVPQKRPSVHARLAPSLLCLSPKL